MVTKWYRWAQRLVSAFVVIVTLWAFFDRFIDQGIYPILETIVSQYRNIVQFFLGPLDNPLRDAVAYIARHFGFQIHLQPHWKDITIPTGLYFAVLASAAQAHGRTTYSRALYVAGIAFALFFGVALASEGGELIPATALPTLVTSVLLYELLAYGLLLVLVSKENRAYAPGFGRYLVEKPLTTLIAGTITALLSQGISDRGNAAAFALVLFIMLLGVRDVGLAVYHAIVNRGGWEGRFKDRLLKSKSWLLGAIVVGVILIATWGISV